MSNALLGVRLSLWAGVLMFFLPQASCGSERSDRSRRRALPEVILAVRNEDIRELARLIEAGADVNAKQESTGLFALFEAAVGGHEEAVKMLLKAGAKTDTETIGGGDAMIAAACNGHTGVVQLLLDAGVPVNRPQTPRGHTYLMKTAASPSSTRTVVEVLVAGGADLERRTDTGKTALMIATSWQPSVTQALIDAGADLNAKDNDGKTALIHAVKGAIGVASSHEEQSYNRSRSYAVENARVLLQAGADVNAKDKRGLSALDIATKNRHVELTGLLRRAERHASSH